MPIPERFLIIIGAAKTGTTSLAKRLSSHPGFCVGPEKEPRFFFSIRRDKWRGPGAEGFVRSSIQDETRYFENFAQSRHDAWAVDASTDYMWRAESVELIERWSRRFDVRVVAITRDPVERIISEYQHTIRDHFQSDRLIDSLRKEEERFRNGYHPLFYHVTRSRYHDTINNFRSAFSDRFITLDFHAAQEIDPLDKVTELCGQKPLSVEMVRENASFVYRSQLAERLSKNDRVLAMLRAVTLPGMRRFMRGKFEKMNRTKHKLSKAEKDFLSEALANEIVNCTRSPFIATDRWSLANSITR